MKKTKWIPIGSVLLLLIGTGIGIFLTSKGNTSFWTSFFPNLWSNILGVSIAAILGVPLGLAANRLYLDRQRAQQRLELIAKFLVEMKNLKMEVESHSAILQSLGQLCQITSTALQPPITAVNMRGFVLRDSEGKRLLADRAALELEEGLVLFNCGVYYHQIAELNQLILARTDQIQQYEAAGTVEAMKQAVNVGVLRQGRDLALQQLNMLDSTIHAKNQMTWTKNTELLREIEDVKVRLERGLSK